MRIVALYGTESGHAEDVALGIRAAFPPHTIEVVDMADAGVDVFTRGALHLIVCATHGGGELPGFAQFLHDDLRESAPDLSDVTYAMFGLGDRSYEARYNRGARLFDQLLSSLGAARIGPFGEHDELSREDHVALGVDWARSVLDAAA